MSAKQVEVIQQVYQAAANGQKSSVTWLDERVPFLYRTTSNGSDIPEEKVDDPRWKPERYLSLDHGVLVQVKLTGRGSESGDSVHRRIGHLWSMRHGESVRLVVYQDWQSGLEAAGISE
jgi:hypothetical protein